MKINRKRVALLAACVISAVSNCAFAEELETYDATEYVVTATRTPLEKKEVPVSVEVIHKEELENSGAITLREALKTATNFVVQEGNVAGHGDEFTLRGGSSDSVLFLINGRRVAGENYFTNGSGNSRILDRINVNNIERIEIVRGQAGALYGSDAQAGVINIITRKSEKPGFSVGFSTGSRQMSNYYHFDTGRQGKVSATFDMNFSKLRNFDGKAGSGAMAYGPQQSFTLDTDYEMDENNKLNLYLDYNKQNLSYLQTISATSDSGDYINSFNTERKTAALTYTGKNDNSDYMVGLTYSRFDTDGRNTYKDYSGNSMATLMTQGIVSAAATEYTDRTYEMWMLEARDSIQTSDNNKLTFGAEYRYNEGSAYVEDGTTDDTKQWAVYVQDEWRISDKLLVIPSVRYNHHDSFGSRTSPNIGVTYFLADNSRFKANYGSAYRAPSIEELYGSFNHMGMFTMYGNPDLKPEKTKGFEISYEHEFDQDTSTRLTYFRNEKEDAISYVGVNSYTNIVWGMMGVTDYQFVNVDSTTNQGIEFEFKRNLGNGLTFVGSYAWLDAKNDETDTQLTYTAKNTYTAKLMWTDPVKSEWSFVAWNRWYTNYNASGDNESEDFVSGNTFHFTVTKRWTDKYRAYFGIDNLFDKELSDLSFYGRLWRCGFEMNF